MSNKQRARTDATVEPLAMVVELGDAAIAPRTVLRAQWPPQETRAAELLRRDGARALRVLDQKLHEYTTIHTRACSIHFLAGLYSYVYNTCS